jgi:hypothetical protein
MYKMNKVFSFHISMEEKDAIEVLRKYDINISRFLRRALRDLAGKLGCRNDNTAMNNEHS